MTWYRAFLERVDGWQQRWRGPAFLVAVLLRYREDRGTQYGALLSYYGFVSIFPLLLVMVTMLGIVLEGDPGLRDQILDTVYAKIPVVGTQLSRNPLSLDSSGLLLLVGLLVALKAGLAVVKHAQDALNLQWSVPRFERPGWVTVHLRAIGVLVLLGVGILATTVVTNLAVFLPDLPGSGRLLGAAFAMVLNVVLLTASYRVLVESKRGWRAYAAGGLAGGLGLWVLSLIGATYVDHVIVDATDVYGTFAIMFGLLVWIGLVARIALVANEINVVGSKHLWPRSLTGNRMTEADHRALEEVTQREAFVAGAPAHASAGDESGNPAQISDDTS